MKINYFFNFIIFKNEKKRSNNECSKKVDNEQEVLDNFLCSQTFLNNFRSKKLETGNYLVSKMDHFKKEIEKEENKYNEQNLKLMKVDLENLNKNFNSKIDLIRESNQKIIQILMDMNKNPDDKTLINSFDEEFKELKRIALLSQSDLPSYSFNILNTVRPVSTPTSNYSNAQNNEVSILGRREKSKKCSDFF